MAHILCDHISFLYETGYPVLSDFTHAFDSSQCTAIVGPSGCGKTTLLHLLSDWKKPTQGHIQITASPQNDVPLFRYVFSSPILINELSVEDNIFLDRPRNVSSLALYRDLLKHFELDLPPRTWPKTLSSGQQQRVGMIRALMGDALFLLADEPTSHLDPVRAYALMERLIARLKSCQRGMICVTHDRNLLPLFDCALDLSKDRTD